jgi:undecaprenyl-diphosphatase
MSYLDYFVVLWHIIRYNVAMSFFDALVLGLVQGLTEFLPISSSGHLILARSLFGIDDSGALAFDAVLQLASIVAVMIYFFPDIWQLTQTALRKLGKLPVNQRDETLLYAILIGTIPAVLLGLSLESLMETLFRSPLLVAAVLIVGSILFMYAEWKYINVPRTNEMTVKKGFQIGLFQSLALIPGMSRSGASMVGGMLLGLTRAEAARFSFLLALPVITGAGLKMFLEMITSGQEIVWGSVIVGAVAAFLSGLIAIHFMISFVRKNTLWPFIWYRIILASFVIFVFVFG